MNHIVTHCPDNGIDKFEEISYLLKQQREGKIESLSEFLRITEERQYARPGKEIQGEESSNFFAKAKKLLDVSRFLEFELSSYLRRYLNCHNCYRKKVVLQRQPKAVKAERTLQQKAVLLLALVDMFPTSLLILECINGVELASVIMRLCFLLKH